MRTAALFACSAMLVAGCATGPPPSPLKPAALPDLAPHTTSIGGVPYLSLNTLSQRSRMQVTWEPATQVLQLVSGTAAVRLSPGFSTALVNGVAVSLGGPVVVQEGQIWVPAPAAGPWVSPLPTPRPAKPLGQHAIRTVVIDPGHGGHDSGAVGPGGLREKDVVLDVARRLRDRLAAENVRVLMTRGDDRFIPLSQRAALANQRKADLFVSIHANASKARAAAGYEAYYLSEATDDAARAFAAAENASLELEAAPSAGVPKDTEAIVWDLLNTENRTESRELAAAVCRGMKWFVPTPNRGVKSARFYVLKWARMPAVLLEIGFVTNRAEGQRLDSATYRQRVADGIAQGLLTYKSLYESTNGFSN
ncbi:MAG: N-acetylmuramoyl-L-alanine amidase [Candidatus Omnitrophica bacterium]|nr:N-acetylmuramoyl-L-alanine amidase [Candidatus Omnitrophota bacterium]